MQSRRDGNRDFRLGEWLVQPSLNRISSSSDEVHLQPRAMELLLFLADHAGQVVSRRQIIDGVWQQEFVSDGAVSGLVVKLRKALGDDPREPRYIEAIVKRGYRLLPRPLHALEVVEGPGGAFRVGEWLVEPDLGRMTRGDAEVQLDRGAMDVLLCLAERAGEPVPRQELIGRAWRDEPVSDLALSLRLEELEEALAGGAAGSRYIEAVPERGFRLAAAVASARPGATVTPFPGVRLEPDRPVFVGREAELARLDAFLQQAVAGDGRVAFVTGEAGTGKTALVSELVRRAQDAHGDLVAAVGLCSDQTGIGDPYAPWRQVLALLTGDIESGSAAGLLSAESARRLWRAAPLALEAVTESGRDLVDTLLPGRALLARAEASAATGAPWLGPLRELVRHKAALPPDAALQQAAVFMQVARVLGAVARRRPLLLVLEDLHWADAGSIGLLFHLGREVASHRILLLGTYRPTEVALGRGGERHPLEGVVAELKARHGRLGVDLGQAGERAFVDAYVDSEPNRLGEGFRASLFRQTAGHALFTVETVRTIQEGGMIVPDPEGLWVEGANLDWATLPERVEGVLAARVERLPDELKDLLAVASVEGEEFSAEVVARVRGSDPREVVRLLSRELEARHRLVRAHGVRSTATGRLSRFGFSHVLFQRYLYGTLNEVERVQLHEDVGTALEALHGDDTEEVAVQLAQHFEQAGITEKAIRYLQQAGQDCVHRTANLEAIGHLRRALELLGTLAPSPERDRTELALQMAIQAPLTAVLGWGHAQLGMAVERAHQLVERVGDEDQRAAVLFQIALFENLSRSIPHSIAMGERLLELAERRGDVAGTVLAHWVVGIGCMWGGELARGRTHLERVVSLYDEAQHRALAFLVGLDPAVASLAHLTTLNTTMGYLDQAVRCRDAAIALAERLGHPYSSAFARWSAMWLHFYRQEHAEVRIHLEALDSMTAENGLTSNEGVIQSAAGLLQVAEGRLDEAVQSCARGVSLEKATGMKSTTGIFLCSLARAHQAAGQQDLALAVLDEADELMRDYGERYLEPQLHLLRGEVLLETEGDAAAQRWMLESLGVARRQGARLNELHAAVALSQLWQRQGKRREAREVLRPVYDAFTEGLDTAPLVEARALLVELEGE